MQWMILPFKRYADFGGRSRRLEFWMFTLLTVLLYAALLVALVAVVEARDEATLARDPAFLIVLSGFALVWLGLLLPSIAVQVRRFHDQNLSGGFVALTFGLSFFIPLIGWVVTIVFMSLRGTAGPNRFGSDPLDPGDAAHLGRVFG